MNKTLKVIISLLLTGCLLTLLVYWLHPETGQLSLLINGVPITEPFVQIALFPLILATLAFTGVVMLLYFIGAGILVFLGSLFFMLLGVFMVAPVLWPLLLFVFIMILLISTD